MKNLLKVIIALVIIIGIILFMMFLFPNEREGVLGSDYELRQGQSITIEGYTIKLVSIADSTCPEDAQCIWEGEYTYSLKINGTNYGLGSVTNKSIVVDDYELKIVDAKKRSLTFRMDKK